jgi:hypothetical protein
MGGDRGEARRGEAVDESILADWCETPLYDRNTSRSVLLHNMKERRASKEVSEAKWSKMVRSRLDFVHTGIEKLPAFAFFGPRRRYLSQPRMSIGRQAR